MCEIVWGPLRSAPGVDYGRVGRTCDVGPLLAMSAYPQGGYSVGGFRSRERHARSVCFCAHKYVLRFASQSQTLCMMRCVLAACIGDVYRHAPCCNVHKPTQRDTVMHASGLRNTHGCWLHLSLERCADARSGVPLSAHRTSPGG